MTAENAPPASRHERDHTWKPAGSRSAELAMAAGRCSWRLPRS